LVITPAHCW